MNFEQQIRSRRQTQVNQLVENMGHMATVVPQKPTEQNTQEDGRD